MALPSKKPIEWERYGLSSELPPETATLINNVHEDEENSRFQEDHAKELFHENQGENIKPWWKTKFFLSEPVLFGVWDGVFTSCMISLFSVIIFLRVGWIIGNAGIVQSVSIVVATVLICTTTVLSGIGICERCHIGSGGVNFLLSHVLGARSGGAISLIYCLGQCVSCALHVMGFAESFSQLVSITNPWIVRMIGISAIIFLLGINLAGVKWVVRIQFILLIFLLLSALDFAVGTFIHVDIAHGVVGYDWTVLQNNTGPDYATGENWFTVFGVFFPAMTGVLAGINMSGDLSCPSRDIPIGTITAVGTSFFIYLIFVLGLGSTCERWALKTDYMIASKVSAIGVLLLAGLYISAMSASLGAFYATPRIIQNMAHDNVIPLMSFLGKGKGPNKVPVYSLAMFAIITCLFVLVGSINTLAPIVTIPFLFTYASVEYAYFSLAMSFHLQQNREENMLSPTFDLSKVAPSSQIISYGSTKESKVSSDLNQLFPERVPHHKREILHEGSSITVSGTDSPLTSPDEHSSVCSADSKIYQFNQNSDNNIISQDQGQGNYYDIGSKQRNWYTLLTNRWLALLGAFIKIIMMFLVHWAYALSAFFIMVVVWFYTGQANPGTFPGIAEFRLFPWLKNMLLSCLGCNPKDYDQIVVTPIHPGVETMSSQLTEENADYASRKRYHHSKAMKEISPAHNSDSD